jgi:transposase
MMTATFCQQEHLGVGIDTGRYGHHVSFMNGERQHAAPPLSIAESIDGYQRLKNELDKLQRKHPHAHFHVRMDAGGQYATNLERFLRGLPLPMTLSIGEPKRNKDYHRAVSPKRKSDASESQAMARFAVVEQPGPTPGALEETSLLREIAGRLEAQVKTTTQAVNRLHNLLSRSFPELAQIVPDIAAGYVLSLLAKYPTPARIGGASLASLEKIPYFGPEQAQKIHAAAKTSVGSLHGELVEPLMRQAVADVKQAQESQKTLEKLLIQAFDGLPHSGHAQVETIVGIGKITAAVLVSKIVSIDRFTTPDQLVGYFGVFPEEHSSGVDRQGQPKTRPMRMSRKGNDLVRKYLFCAAKSAIQHNPAVKALYARLRARGTRGNVAMGHCMRKLLHQVFGVWASDTPFDKNYRRRKDVKGEESVDEPTPVSDAAPQQETAGPKQEFPPDRKEVTAAMSKVGAADAHVNGSAELVEMPPATGRRGSVDYAYLRSQVTMEQVLRRMGHFEKLWGRGQLRGPCPFHQGASDKSRAFSVSLEKNVFRCCDPTCGAQGNALDLWARHTGLPLYEAALSLAAAFQLDVTRTEKRQPVT